VQQAVVVAAEFATPTAHRAARRDSAAERDSDRQALYSHVVEQIAPLGLAYVHVIEGETGGARKPADASKAFDYAVLRRRFPGACTVNKGYSRADAVDAVASGRAGVVARAVEARFHLPACAAPRLGH
jgi:2,4-dienoyl-CoA reductase-like NADH-dependent reductase (Old Yellow Enzyme family)